jgi:DNA invertase Pin-like site-specific DNA recombinase
LEVPPGQSDIKKERTRSVCLIRSVNILLFLHNIPTTGTDIDCILEGINKYLLLLAKEQIRLAFEQSEKEVQDLRQRTKEGMQTARLSGKQIGQASGTKFVTKKSIAAKEIILKHNKTFGGSLNDLETITQAGITRKTFYKYKKELLSKMAG